MRLLRQHRVSEQVVAFGATFHRLLQLNRDVVNAEVAGDDLPQAVQQGFEIALVVGIGEDVSGERVVARGQCPGYNIRSVLFHALAYLRAARVLGTGTRMQSRASARHYLARV